MNAHTSVATAQKLCHVFAFLCGHALNTTWAFTDMRPEGPGDNLLQTLACEEWGPFAFP